MKPHLIVNPASGNGRTGRDLDRIAQAVRGAVGDFECAITRAPGHATSLAREAARAGARLVVGVGGDGTASEVIDGLCGDAGEGGEGGGVEVAFGCIPRGSGGDLRRSLGWPEDLDAAARVLAQGAIRTVDLGRVELTRLDGTRAVRTFANVASAGVSARVVEIVEGMGKTLGGPITFKIGAARALLGWRDRAVRWRLDGGPWREDAITALCVCNGGWFGGGMRVAPSAALDDGLLDVTVWSGFGVGEFVLRQRMLYDGSHVTLAKTRTYRGRTVEVEPLHPDDPPVLLEVDGELPGRLPARFSVLPRALRVRVPPPPLDSASPRPGRSASR